ncbi:MAG: hypothetical protein PHF95_05885 [bacterium]|nr:hypothetical protein [bacterium]
MVEDSLLLISEKSSVPELKWAVPDSMGIPPDQLCLRLDFFHQAIQMTEFDEEITRTRMVSAYDIALALSNELNMGSGILPENTIWWKPSKGGAVYAVYVPPGIRRLAYQTNIKDPTKRYNVPMPPLIFLCSSGREPWVYAVKEWPKAESAEVYKAPLLNIFENGKTCPGSNKYPVDSQGIIREFFISFFTNAADVSRRSKKYQKNVLELWKDLDKNGAKNFPMDDLVYQGTVKDLLMLNI